MSIQTMILSIYMPRIGIVIEIVILEYDSSVFSFLKNLHAVLH